MLLKNTPAFLFIIFKYSNPHALDRDREAFSMSYWSKSWSRFLFNIDIYLDTMLRLDRTAFCYSTHMTTAILSFFITFKYPDAHSHDGRFLCVQSPTMGWVTHGAAGLSVSHIVFHPPSRTPNLFMLRTPVKIRRPCYCCHAFHQVGLRGGFFHLASSPPRLLYPEDDVVSWANCA